MSTTKASLRLSLFLTLSLAAPALGRQRRPPRQPISRQDEGALGEEPGRPVQLRDRRPQLVLPGRRSRRRAPAGGGLRRRTPIAARRHHHRRRPVQELRGPPPRRRRSASSTAISRGPSPRSLFGRRFSERRGGLQPVLASAIHLRPPLRRQPASHPRALRRLPGVTIPLLPAPGRRSLEVAAVANFPAQAYFDAQRVLLAHWALPGARRGPRSTSTRSCSSPTIVASSRPSFRPGTRGLRTTVIEQGNEIEFRPFGNFGLGMRLPGGVPLLLQQLSPARGGAVPRLGAAREGLLHPHRRTGRAGRRPRLRPGPGARSPPIRVALGSKW